MSDRYDVAVIGLGAMGSAAAAHAARRGARTIGIERFELGHDRGASGGRSRIIRKAYFESPQYVPLLERAYDLWRELERSSGTRLLQLCGVLIAGDPRSQIVAGVGDAARRYGIPVERLTASELRERFPQMEPLPGEIGILEPEAGIVFPEAGIAAHLDSARQAGATLIGSTRVLDANRTGEGFALRLDGGRTIAARHAIVCAGPWLASAFAGLHVPISVQRNVLYWFAPLEPVFSPDRLPAFLLDRPGLPAPLYGFPDLGDGVKIAFHGHGDHVDPDALDRDVHEGEIATVHAALHDWMPQAAGAFLDGKACMYAMTPDAHFAIGRDPASGLVVAGGFSGHGYKFAPVVGELLAQLALDGRTRLDIGFLSPQRFRQSA
jgi:sarcosine oxidase